MNDLVIDSCVMAKWLLPEVDSEKARQLSDRTEANGGHLIVLDIAIAEVGNAIWKRCHRSLISPNDARVLVDGLRRLAVHIEPSAGLIPAAMDISLKYGRSMYDALFVALTEKTGLRGVTSDEPLFNMTRAAFPRLELLRHFI